LKAGHQVGQLTILAFVIASVVVAVVGTYITDYFGN